MTFLNKSYGEYSKVKKHVILTTSYEGSDNEEEPEIVPVEYNNNGVNMVSNSNNDLSNDDHKNEQEIFFDEEVDDKVISTPKPTLNAKVYNNDANNIIEDATHIKVSKIQIFSLIWRWSPPNPYLYPRSQLLSIKLGIILMQLLEKNGEKPFAKNLPK